jgi:hypothetical protein
MGHSGREDGSEPADRPLRELEGRTLRWLRLVAPDYYLGVASALSCAKVGRFFSCFDLKKSRRVEG